MWPMVEQATHACQIFPLGNKTSRHTHTHNTGPEVDDPISLVVSIGETHACRLDWRNTIVHCSSTFAYVYFIDTV
jgi:hypothetical protein